MFFIIPYGKGRAILAMGLVGAGLAFFGGRQLYIAQTETKPTSVDIMQWSAKYQGEQWLSVTGQLDPAQSLWEKAADGKVVVFAPFVVPNPASWQQIHAVLRISAASRADAHDTLVKLAKSPYQPVTGVVSTHENPRLPIDKLAGDAVVIDYDGVPAAKTDHGYEVALSEVCGGGLLFLLAGFCAFQSLFSGLHHPKDPDEKTPARVGSQSVDARPYF